VAVPVQRLGGRRPTDAQLAELGRWFLAVSDALGARVIQSVTDFARTAEPGAMLTVRRTRDGFTAQTTGSIVGGAPEPFTLDAIDAITREAN